MRMIGSVLLLRKCTHVSGKSSFTPSTVLISALPAYVALIFSRIASTSQPACHAGRDALVGICLFLSHLAHEKKTVSELRATYPAYFMGKNRIDLKPGCDVDAILEKIKATYAGKAEINTVDGVKLDFPETWVHLRKSNTEPIIRIYSEGPTQEAADAIGEEILALANSLM